MKVLRKVHGKRCGTSLLHIRDKKCKDLIGICGIWINYDNWVVEECDDDFADPDFICSKCLAKRDKIKNPPPQKKVRISKEKKVRISKEARLRNEREAKREAEETKLRAWNKLCEKKG